MYNMYQKLNYAAYGTLVSSPPPPTHTEWLCARAEVQACNGGRSGRQGVCVRRGEC